MHGAFIKLHGGVETGRGGAVTQFVHSAVNWLWRPGVGEKERQRAEQLGLVC